MTNPNTVRDKADNGVSQTNEHFSRSTYETFLTNIKNTTDASNIIGDILNIFPNEKLQLANLILNFVFPQIKDKSTCLNLTSNIFNNFNDADKCIMLTHLLSEVDDIKEKSRTILLTLQSMQEDGNNFIKNLYNEIKDENPDNDNNDHDSKRMKKQNNAENNNKNQTEDIEMTSNTQDTDNNLDINNEFQFPTLRKNKKRRNSETNETNKSQVTPNTSSQNTEKKQKPVPPITLADHKTYLAIKRAQPTSDFKITSAKDMNNRIKIYPETPDDHRKITKILDQHNQEYYSINIEDEQLFKVVIKGLPTFIDTNDIKDEIEQTGITITKIDRMYKKLPDGTKNFYNSILVQLPKNASNRKIYNITQLQSMIVTIEPKHSYATIVQCHRCQRFGHNHRGCKMTPRCHRCAEDHHFTECKKSTQTPAKCCNCGQAHPANAPICPRRPQITNKQQNQTTNTQTPTINPTTEVNATTPTAQPSNINNTTYAQTCSSTSPNQILNTLIKQMNDTTKVLSAYLSSQGFNIQL